MADNSGQHCERNKKFTKIGLVAGGGMMPLEIIRSCRSRGIEVCVAGLRPWADESMFADVSSRMAHLGEIGGIMKFFREHGVSDLVMAGGIKRPALKELIPDFEAVKILARIALKKQSDNGLFSALIGEIEARGFRVFAIQDVVPEMLFREGIYGRVKPSAEDMDDIRRGIEVARAIGGADIGQAVVLQEGIVLAVEAAEGTDAMLSRAASLKKPGKAPVVVKMVKPGQDTRVDLPAIGLQTVEQLAKYGMAGIAVEAGGILLIEREAVVAAADAVKVFIFGATFAQGL